MTFSSTSEGWISIPLNAKSHAKPGSARTFNEPYLRRVEKYFAHLAAEVRPRLATRGGPVQMVQVENEYDNVAGRYGAGGQKYLHWLGQLADRLGFDVPRTMCEAGSSEKGAAVEGVIATVNGFSISAERAESFQRAHPGTPMLWTELWPGWYDTWGFQNHFRDPVNIARCILKFVAHGGCGWNYYMWYAGTNFGRTAMYLQTTNYGFGAPLDEYGRITPGACLLGELHHVLRRNEAVLLEGERHQSGVRTTWRLGNESLMLDLEQTRAVLRDGGGRVLFDTGAPRHETRQAPSAGWRRLAALENWKVWPEPRPDTRVDEPVKSRDPVEQLQLTCDASDYCWYAARFEVKSAGPVMLEIPYGGDFLRVYIDGKQVATTELPLRECRGSTIAEVAVGETTVQGVAVDPAGSGPRYSSRFVFRARAGAHRLEILAASLGLIKGDWMVSASMETERKGIWAGVKLNGKPLCDWTMFPQLAGEQFGIPRCPAAVAWKMPRQPVALAWHRARFAIPARLLRDGTDFRIDADGLGKGMLFVNGHALGRHWLIEARGFGHDQFWVEADKHSLTLGPAGEPTQRYYRVPAFWLRKRNELIIFEEEACAMEQVRLQYRSGANV